MRMEPSVHLAGNVGIGTSSPSQKLDVSGTVSADRYLSTSSSASLPSFGVSSGNGIYLAGTNIIGFSTNSTERVRIDASGNVGIGTSSPTSKLHVQGTSYFFDQSIFSDKVGIGTSSPNAKLESLDGDIKVTTQSAFAGFITSRNTIPSSGGTQLGRLQYSAYSTGTTYVDGAAIQAFSTEAWSASSTPSWLSLQTVASGSTSLVERVRIDSDGLKFNGDTAAANALDDYEEGTWTPIVNDLTNEATMISGTTGFYTKIGRQVTLSGYVRTTSIGSVSGDVYIGGMPFTSNGSLGSETSVTFGYFTAMNLGAAGVSVGAYIVPATTRMALYINDVATGITAMQGSEWGNTGYVHLGITYFV
jgi:hypothetical protein